MHSNTIPRAYVSIRVFFLCTRPVSTTLSQAGSVIGVGGDADGKNPSAMGGTSNGTEPAGVRPPAATTAGGGGGCCTVS